ncbi:MAG TPA: hypothetical protein VMT18_16220 [Planctomycetota bacterium]|nr:hypothetical protein [Planctomycetota bacterium]
MSEAAAAAALDLGALREAPFTGVIWVVHEASKRGFANGHPDWCTLGLDRLTELVRGR